MVAKSLWITLLCTLSITIGKSQSGFLDPGFGNHGLVKSDLGKDFNYSNAANQVLVLPDSNIYFITQTSGGWLVNKKHSDGNTDISYGNSGRAVVPINVVQSAVQKDGKLVLGGFIYKPNDYYNYTDFAIVRLKTDGNLDSSFGAAGIQITPVRDNDFTTGISIQENGQILLAGSSESFWDFGSYVTIIRYNPDGTLDVTFGANGIVTSSIGSPGYPQAITAAASGKILVTGYSYYPDDANLNKTNITIARYLEDGRIDSSFSNDGIQVIDLGYTATAIEAAVQKDDRIIVAGSILYQENLSQSLLLRFNAFGNLDSSFDTDGIRYLDTIKTLTKNCLIVQPDNKLLVAGTTITNGNADFITIRLKNNGAADGDFSLNGIQRTDFVYPNDQLTAIVLQNDGKIIVFGNSGLEDRSVTAAARYDNSGSLDSQFGENGLLQDFLKQGSTFYTSTAVQKDGKMLAAGCTWNGNNYDFLLARFNLNGSYDSSFAGKGYQVNGFELKDSKANAIIIQPDGKIVLGGDADADIALIRYNTNGTVDSSFGNFGRVLEDLGADDYISKLIVQPDGKILASGSAIARFTTTGDLDTGFNGNGILITSSTNFDIALQKDGRIIKAENYGDLYISRFNEDGHVDSSFAENGQHLIYISDWALYITTVALQADGRIVIGGSTRFAAPHLESSEFLLIKANPDGYPDPQFNNGQLVHTGINSLTHGTSMVIQNDNKIILAGYSFNGINDDFTLARFDTGGVLDPGFGNNGAIVTQAGSSNDRVTGIVQSGGSLYAVGNGDSPGNMGIAARYLLESEDGPLANGFITVADGDWNDPTIWLGKTVPDASSKVIIHHKVAITSNATCYSLKIESATGFLTLTTGYNLTITH